MHIKHTLNCIFCRCRSFYHTNIETTFFSKACSQWSHSDFIFVDTRMLISSIHSVQAVPTSTAGDVCVPLVLVDRLLLKCFTNFLVSFIFASWCSFWSWMSMRWLSSLAMWYDKSDFTSDIVISSCFKSFMKTKRLTSWLSSRLKVHLSFSCMKIFLDISNFFRQ